MATVFEFERAKPKHIGKFTNGVLYRSKLFIDSYKENKDEMPHLWKNMNKMKNELKFTLSEPLKRRAAGNIKRACDHAVSLRIASSVRQKVTELSNRFAMPKFFQSQQQEQLTSSSSSFNARIDDEASSSVDSDDPEFQELQERSIIVERYEKGPEQIVEDWENPDFELYKVTDRYGFVHKDESIFSTMELEERKRIAKETSRESKWIKMIGQWQRNDSITKLHSRVWKGIPGKFRSQVWPYLLEVSKHKHSSQQNLYKELLMRARLVSKDIKQIDLDINRTYRDHMAFRRRYDIKQKSLFNVLAAYAMYNTEVGYCQGMSQVAALFLMYMDEEDAFWCLHALLVNERHSMHGFFVPGFPKLVRFQAHYEKVLQKYLPRVKKHLDKAGIPPIYLTKWWFGCYLDRVPFSLALRLWDVFLLEGDAILMAMSYNIMKMHQKSIRRLQIENFMNYIQTTLASDFGYPDQEVMHSLEECLRRLRSDGLALPPPPGPNDPPERPTKPLGPILTRSMIDIRLDIAEIQSRHSRANSVAGRSPGSVYRGRAGPSPTPVRNELKANFEVQKEDPEVPSSSSASTIKSLKEVRSGTQTPLLQPSLDSSSPRHSSLSQPERATLKASPQQPGPSLVIVPDTPLNKGYCLGSPKSLGEEVVVTPGHSPLADKPSSFPSNKTTRYERSAMITSRYPVPSSKFIPEDQYNQVRGSNIMPDYPNKREGSDVVELSRGTQFRRYGSPPEPPIDYDISPSFQQNVDVSPKFSTHNNFQGTTAKSFNFYQVDRRRDQYTVPERKINSPPRLDNWPKTGQNVNNQPLSRSHAKENEEKRIFVNQRQSCYDNVDDLSTTLSILPKTLEDSYDKPDTYSRRTGKILYSTKSTRNPSSGQFRHDYYNASSGSHVVPGKMMTPSRNHSEQRYNSQEAFYFIERVLKMETRVIQMPNNVTYVSVGEEANRTVRKGHQQRFPMQTEFYPKPSYTGTRNQNDQRLGFGDEKLPFLVQATKAVNLHSSNVGGGEPYSLRPKFVTSERHYPPDTASQPRYHSPVVQSHQYFSNTYGNRSLL